MPTEYFSDRELGPRSRTAEDISETAWGGLVAYIDGLVAKGAFAEHFPEECADGYGAFGTNESMFLAGLRAEVPDIPWPLRHDTIPPALTALDFLEFCYEHVSTPIQGSWHSFFQHHHLSFEQEPGRSEFRAKVNRIFSRNGLAYELKEAGQVERLGPPVLREMLSTASFRTGDTLLDSMLASARTKFLSSDPSIRAESLEKLWDAWERLKTLEGSDKKNATAVLLAKAAPEAKFRQVLDEEGKALTAIGNKFHIRHSETTQTPLGGSEHIDYLFHRLFSFIHLLLRSL